MRLLRAAALIAIPIGGVGAVLLMLRAGREAPRLLQLMMGLWVVSPFAGLAAAEAIAERWTARVRIALHGTALALTPATVAVYGAIASSPTKAQTPFFVLVPPASWLLTAIVVLTTALLMRKR